ncbi:MAG TPA: hypothetical protein GX734_06455 [Clostridiaceae bacterium]|jgi:hypothetical protein|nr:hypothetical protein [Clostridiaceae bacterium]
MDKKELSLNKIIRRDMVKYAEIAFELSFGEAKETLWYRVKPEYGKYLCEDRADSFVVTFFALAMQRDFNLRSTYPISEKLWYQITTQVMPQLVVTSDGVGKEIEIIADRISESCKNEGGVGTGMSCGVDSFATLYEYTELCDNPEYKLTHLTHFNVGAHHGQTGTFNPELQRNLFQKDVAMVQRFCDKYGYQLIAVDSNLTEVIDKIYGYMDFNVFHTYLNVGTVLLMQPLFARYYYSPFVNLDKFHCSLKEDPAYYEKWLLPNLSTEITSFYNSNKNWTREDKLKQIVNFPQSYKWLKVCVKSDTNCCKCVKCMRTILGLEAIGKTDLYSEVFDSKIVASSREHLKTYMLCQVKKGEVSHTEIYNEAVKNGMTFSFKSRAYAFFYRLCLKLLPRKLYFKIKQKSMNDTLQVDVNELFSDASVKRREEQRKQAGKH